MKSIAALTILLGLSFLSFSDNFWTYLQIDGYITTIENGTRVKLPNGQLHVYGNFGFIKTVNANEKGWVKVFLEYDNDFILEFSCKNYRPKRMLVTTKNVSKEKHEFGFEYGGFHMTLEKVGTSPTTATSKPPIEIYYNPELKMFDHR